MSTNFDFELLDEVMKAAPTAGFGPQVNFGKVTMAVKIIGWKDRKPQERDFKAGEKVADGEYLQIHFECDLSEFNPALSTTWKRRVDVKKSGKNALTDWTETVEPSLIKAIGKDWAKKFAKGVYCEFEDVETVQLGKDGKPKGWDKEVDTDDGPTIKHYVNTAPRFVRVFKSAAECGAARAERYTKKENGDDLPQLDGGIPDDVINDVKGLLASIGEKKTRKMLAENEPFNEYDVDELINAAKDEEEDEE